MKENVRWENYVARSVDDSIIYKVLVGEADRKTPFGRPRHGWMIH
jgi:hypothetical protein